MPAAPPVRTLPLVFVLTMALVGASVVAGTVLLTALDAVYSQQLQSNLQKEGQLQADYLAETFSRMLWNFDLLEAQAVGAAVARNTAILELEVVSDTGKLVVHESKAGIPAFRLSRSLVYQHTAVGTLTLTMSRQVLDAQRFEVSTAALEAFGGLLIILAILAPLLLNQTVLRPFNRLSRALVNEAGEGPFPNLPAPSSKITEIRTLESALVTLNHAVSLQVDVLESRVLERTRELQEAQALLVRTETLSTLGQLAAGIAHELNTPLGAILSSVRLLQDDWNLTVIPVLGARLEISGVLDATAFLQQVAAHAARLDDYPDALTRRALRARWKASGRDPETPLSDLVCTTGVLVMLDLLAAIPEEHPANDVILLVGNWGRGLAIISSATDKSASVVSALRAQVQPGAGVDPKPLELRREIGQSLSLMQSKLRSGIHVEVRAPAETWVLGDPNDLSKVWLNLVLNAVQAMEGSGTLEIRISAHNEWATVEISDSGPGIAPEVLPRIWEPFYTTKPAGMGLGLEITKRIVDQNRGSIGVQTEPGRTTFRVRLPLWNHSSP